jgi:adenylate kinase
MITYTFLLFGRSGCGKGTQAKLLIDYLEKKDGKGSVLYIYAGEKFRELVKRDSLTAKLANEILLAGDKIPDFLAVWVWSNLMVEKMRDDLHLVIDGSPRTVLEAKALDDAFAFYKRSDIKPVLIDVAPEEIRERLLKRGRSDDTEEQIARRLAYYEKYVVGAVDYYKNESKNKLLMVDGNPHDINLIHRNILKSAGFSN